MATDFIEVEGIEETCQWLDGVASAIATRAYVNGLAAAGDVIESALWAHVPVDLKAALNKAHGGKGALVTRLTRVIEVDPHGRGGLLEVGFGPLGHIALWVEYGHVMQGHKPELKVLGEVQPHPFMRPTLDACAERAIEAFVEAVKSTLKSATSGYSDAA